jgi:hypothetical protein
VHQWYCDWLSLGSVYLFMRIGAPPRAFLAHRRMQSAVESDRTRDKVPGFDPGAAPLGPMKKAQAHPHSWTSDCAHVSNRVPPQKRQRIRKAMTGRGTGRKTAWFGR